MKALIVSDNHRDAYRLEELLNIYGNEIDLWLHCGDSEFGVSHPLWDTFKTVKGNMDWEDAFPLVRIEKLGTENLGVVHGHKHQVKSSLKPMSEIAENNEAAIVFYGHTHVAKVEEMNQVFYINPGSISQPRGEIRMGSYAIYEKSVEGAFIRFYDWNHNELNELSQKLV